MVWGSCTISLYSEKGGVREAAGELDQGPGRKSITASDDLAGMPASVRTKGRAVFMIHRRVLQLVQRLYNKLRYSLAG